MMTRKYFGTDGVRGLYGSEVMNENFAWRLGAAAARFAREVGSQSRMVFIGRDTRASGITLERAVAAGLKSEGFSAVSLGIVPTPAVSLAVQREGAALGVVITASHNPASDNGIKFFGAAGIKLTDEQEARVEQFLPASAGAATGELERFDASALYIDAVGRLLAPHSLGGWRIVLDTAHGAACATSRQVLASLGAELVLLGNSPDGANINEGVGSQHPEAMCDAVLHHKARLGIAHDGDADRCVLCDENGSILDGDELLTMLALDGLARGRLAHGKLVVTVQSNLGVDAAVQAAGGMVLRTAVGDRYVIERMRAEGANLGGESSGHVICSDVSPTGDGLVAALKVLDLMVTSGRPLSELRRGLKKFPQLSRVLRVEAKVPIANLQTVPACIANIETQLGSSGRVLVRYSGTEPILRLLVEGTTNTVVLAAMQQLEQAARADLQVI